MDAELKALAAADFDSVKRLADIWRDDACDVPALNARVRQRLFRELDALAAGAGGERSPLGLVLAGAGGVGKTHLLSALRKRTGEMGGYFIMVNMTGASDFWRTLLRGILESLHCPGPDGTAQHHALSEAIIRASGGRGFPDGIDAYFREDLRHHIRKVLDELHGKHPWEAGVYADVIRAALLLASGDRGVFDCGRRWLQGKQLDNEEARVFGFESLQAEPPTTAAGLCWLFSLGGGLTVLALDQLDALAERRLALIGTGGNREDSHEAGRIIAETAEGLSALVDLTRRTLVVVSCLASTWTAFAKFSFRPFLERFDAPIPLLPARDAGEAAALVAARMRPACEAAGFTPPYPTWPFRPEAFAGVQLFPRYILQLCRRHIQRCLAEGRVVEAASLTGDFPDGDQEEAPPETDSESVFQKIPAEASEDSSEETFKETFKEVSEKDSEEIFKEVYEKASKVDFEEVSESFPPEKEAAAGGIFGDNEDAEPVEVLAEIPPPRETSPLTAAFRRLCALARPEEAKDVAGEEEFWRPALAAFARAVAADRAAAGVDSTVSVDTPENGGMPKFHARLGFGRAGGTGPERFLYLRAILQDNIQPFRSRLKSFMEEPAGVDIPPESRRRSVVIFPGCKAPMGKGRPKYRRDFEQCGALAFPSDPEIRALAALAAVEREYPAAWADWVRGYRPLGEIRFLDRELAWLFGEGGAG